MVRDKIRYPSVVTTSSKMEYFGWKKISQKRTGGDFSVTGWTGGSVTEFWNEDGVRRSRFKENGLIEVCIGE